MDNEKLYVTDEPELVNTIDEDVLDDESDEGMSEEELDSLVLDEESNENARHNKDSIDYEIDPVVKNLFTHTYISKKLLMLVPRYLCYKGDLSKGFIVNDALQMPIKEAIAYAFYFASLNIKKKKELRDDYEAARQFIIKVIQSDESNEVKEYAKTAFWLFFQGYVEMITRRYYAYLEHSDVREEAIENGMSYVWMHIYSKKIMRYKGQVAVTTFFGAFIASWLEECEAEKVNASREQYRQDRRVKRVRNELMIELDRDPTLSEVVQRSGLNIHQVVGALSRIEHHEKECSLNNLESPENLAVNDVTKDEQSSICENPEKQYIQNERMSLMYRALQSLLPIEQTVFLLCNGMEIYDGHVEYINTEADKNVLNPMKQFNKVAKMLNTSARDIENIYQKAKRKLNDFCEIRKNVRNEHITNQDAFLSFNKKDDDDWVIEFLGISNFKPD